MTIGDFNLFGNSRNSKGFDIEAAARLATASLHEAEGIKGITRLDGRMPDGPPGKSRSFKSGLKAGA